MRQGRRHGLRALVLLGAALAALLAGIALGSVPIPAGDLLAILGSALLGLPLPAGIDPVLPGLVLELRLPRALLAFVVGAALASSGAVIQSILKNPLASSYGLGVSAGAGLGVAVLMVLGVGGGALGALVLPAAGLVCGLAAVAAAMALSGRLDRSLSNDTIILTGMVISLFLNAILTTLASASPAHTQRILLFQMGSFSMRGWQSVQILLPVTVAGVIYFTLRARALDVMTFGEEQATALGVELRRTKWALIGAVALLTGTAVAFVGIVGFVDLIAPHVVRRFFGATHRWVVPMSALFGGAFLVLCDLAARTLTAPGEIPIGSITALLGAPFFLYLYFAGRKGR